MDFPFQSGIINPLNSATIAVNEMERLIRLRMRQEKGQRIFRPVWNVDCELMEPGCEIFVGRLPRDAFEEELIPLFASLGEIHECRLMMDFSGLTRGFCYVTYTCREMADGAVKYLHGLRIRPNGEKIYCYHSLDNRRLYMEGLPTNRSVAEIEHNIKSKIPGVHRVILYTSPSDCVNLGFIEFINHRYAANCRKRYWPKKLEICNTLIYLEWAVPLPYNKKNNLLLIKNLDPQITKYTLVRELLKICSDRLSVINIYKRQNYAIMQFLLEKDAVAALQVLRGKTIGDSTIIPKLFLLTEEGEKNLMLELQLSEHHPHQMPNGIDAQ